jgi:hypothetical protein
MLRSDGNKNKPNAYLVLASRAASGHVVFAVISDGEQASGQDIYAYGLDKSFNATNGGTNKLTVVARGQKFKIFSNGVELGEFDPTTPVQAPRMPSPPATPTDPKNAALVDEFNKAKAEYDQTVSEIKSTYAARLKDSNQANKVFDSGFVAMAAASESGHTECQFNNTWLWLIEP